MDQDYYSIGELAEISGTTVRTIQYYDQIGLLEAKRSESNLRYYTQFDLVKLQQILFYKRVDFPLKEIKELVRNVNSNNDLVQVLERQSVILFQKEMEIKMNQVIIDVVKSTLEGDPETDLEPLIKLILGLEKQTIMDYNKIDYGIESDQNFDLSNIQIESVLEMYWDWKQLVLEASNLKLNHTDIESQSGYEIGKRWHEFLKKVEGDNTQIRQAAEKGAEFSEQWPKEDLFLYNFSEDFIEDAYQYYLKKKGLNHKPCGILLDLGFLTYSFLLASKSLRKK